MDEKLQACAHCGGAAEVHYRQQSEEPDRCRLQCIECGIATLYYPSYEEAAAAWNRRAVPKGYVIVTADALETLVEAAVRGVNSECEAHKGYLDLPRFDYLKEWMVAVNEANAALYPEDTVAATGERDG